MPSEPLINWPVTLPETIKVPAAPYGVSTKENTQWAIREAYLDSVLSARIHIRCDPLVSLVG